MRNWSWNHLTTPLMMSFLLCPKIRTLGKGWKNWPKFFKLKWKRSSQSFIYVYQLNKRKTFNQSILNNVISYVKATSRFDKPLVGAGRSWNQSNISDGVSFAYHLGFFFCVWLVLGTPLNLVCIYCHTKYSIFEIYLVRISDNCRYISRY